MSRRLCAPSVGITTNERTLRIHEYKEGSYTSPNGENVTVLFKGVWMKRFNVYCIMYVIFCYIISHTWMNIGKIQELLGKRP